MKAILFATFLIAAHGAHGSVIDRNIRSGENKELKFVGSADGKDYFYDASIYGTWKDAGDICLSADMQLASISSENQLEMLNSTTLTELPQNFYWTSGRDSYEIRQFTWNNTNFAVPELVKDIFVGTSVRNYRTCLKLLKFNDHDISLFIDACTSRGYTLCST